MPTQKLEFTGHGGEVLAARFEGLGIAVLRFDFTGLGHSQGEFANTHFSSNIADLVAAARHLEGLGQAPALLIGHSLGGAAVLAAAAQIPSAKAVVTIGAPADPGHVIHNFGGKLDEIKALTPAISALKRALLVLHAPGDQTVGIENAGEIFGAAKHPKSFVTLDDADHLLSRSEDAEYAWSRRYLGLKDDPARPGAPEGVVRVSEADPAGFLQDVEAGPKHHVLADEPAAYGGTDAGPTPYQFLSAGLGACTSMTVRMYARRKGWPLEHVSVDVSHDKVHAQDCADCPDKNAKIDVFQRRIRLDGPLDADQRARLLAIADRCPVHRTLEGNIKVETVLAEA
jgi:putative redox protein